MLSAGHASMLLYSLLHLTGYDVSLDDLKSFRQWGSITPGHPEYGLTPGVEATTGPLGQGLGNAVGMAIAERRLAEEFNRPGHDIVDHRTYVIASDGDLQEGVASEACSLAGHLRLGKLVVLYDDNRIQLDGPTAWAFTEDVLARFDAYGWHVQRVEDGNDVAGDLGRHRCRQGRRPAVASSPSARTSATAARTSRTRRRRTAPRSGPDEVRLTKEAYGWDPDRTFYVPDEAAEAVPPRRSTRARTSSPNGRRALDRYAAELPGRGRRAPAPARRPACPTAGTRPSRRTRSAPRSPRATRARTRSRRWPAVLPELFGGSADLSESNLTDVKANGHDHFEADHAGRNLRFGVREHAMGAIANGIAYHGGFLPYCATFLTFSDYMRGSVRLAALSGLHVTYVWTHDSVGLGEDGPTHQPVEHYAALRAIPNLWFVRPGDANEAAAAWALAVERPSIAGAAPGPVALAFTRQKLPTLAGSPEKAREGLAARRLRPARGVGRRAAADPHRDRLGAAALLRGGRGARGRRHPDARREPPVLGALRGPGRRRTATRSCRRRCASGSRSRSASRWAGSAGSATRARSSASTTSARARPAGTIFKEFGFTSERVADVGRRVVREGLRGRQPTLSSPHGSHPTLGDGTPASTARRAATRARLIDQRGDRCASRSPRTTPGPRSRTS